MLHAEVLARLKHPRPLTIHGRSFEARTTPVHFMMTSDHKAASIEFRKLVPETRRLAASPYRSDVPAIEPQPFDFDDSETQSNEEEQGNELMRVTEPNDDTPHVLISLALEDDQQLDLDGWEEWLAAFPALAKHCKVQGLFKSHSTTLLLSLPVMVWDLLPNDPACAFVAFIRSNNLLLSAKKERQQKAEAGAGIPVSTRADTTSPAATTGNPLVNPEVIVDDNMSSYTGTTYVKEHDENIRRFPVSRTARDNRSLVTEELQFHETTMIGPPRPPTAPTSSFTSLRPVPTSSSSLDTSGGGELNLPSISRTMIHSQTRGSRRRVYGAEQDVPETPRLAKHVIERLEEYFQREPLPDASVTDFLASNLGIETHDVDVSWR